MEELTEYEKDVLDTFKKLIKNAGAITCYHFGEETIFPARTTIAKRGDKWVSYIYEKGEYGGFREYDDVYDLVIDTFDGLGPNLSYYFINNLPSKEEFKSRHKQK